METVRADFEQFEVSVEQVLHDEDDALVVVERLRGRGRESGAEVQMTTYVLYRFDDEGKVVLRRAFTSAEDAWAEL